MVKISKEEERIKEKILWHTLLPRESETGDRVWVGNCLELEFLE